MAQRVSIDKAPEPQYLTPDEATRRLAVASVNTIRRWVREGQLEGVRRGEQVFVSRRSVDALLGSTLLAAEQEYERGLNAVLAEFDAGDGPVEPLGLTTTGRAPWTSLVADHD
jgi:excisionase family DNA binding protein